nr:MAG TPA: Protein of unknown function (DUF2612) [Caudoviricetes sp.]
MALIDNYLKLITSQHMNQPKYREMLESLLRYSDDIFSLVVTLDDEFDVELATGIQEDILGCLVGINRNLNFQPEKDLSSVLDNAAYRTLLLAKIAQNMWTGGILDLRELWYSLFGSGIIIQDNQNMTIDVIIVGEFITQIIKNAIKEGYIIPKPLSVRINSYYSDGPVFGYDMETNIIKGFDHAKWIETETIESFAYDVVDEVKKLYGYDRGYWT